MSPNRQLVGKRLNYNAGASSRLLKAIRKELKLMAKDYERELRKVERSTGMTFDASIASQSRITLNKLAEKWTARFVSLAKMKVPEFIEELDTTNQRELAESLASLTGVKIETPKRTAELTEQITASIAESVSLITNVGEQFRQRTESAVMRSIQNGGLGRKTIFDHLRDFEGMAERRARLIAEDQTRKITAAMNTERMKSTGIKKWRWLHSGGGAEPRKLHLKLNGQEFTFDDPPVIDDRTGEKGFPGQLINCKCVMVPVLNLEDL